VAYVENFHGWVHSVAYGGHLYLGRLSTDTSKGRVHSSGGSMGEVWGNCPSKRLWRPL